MDLDSLLQQIPNPDVEMISAALEKTRRGTSLQVVLLTHDYILSELERHEVIHSKGIGYQQGKNFNKLREHANNL